MDDNTGRLENRKKKKKQAGDKLKGQAFCKSFYIVALCCVFCSEQS